MTITKEQIDGVQQPAKKRHVDCRYPKCMSSAAGVCDGPCVLSSLTTQPADQQENERLRAQRDEATARADRMANDWADFCVIMNVDFDTQEAVADELQFRIDSVEDRATSVEVRVKALEEVLRSAEPYVEIVHSLTYSKGHRAQVWAVMKAIRAALKGDA